MMTPPLRRVNPGSGFGSYIESAPWNNQDITPTPEFRGIGLRLMQAAVQYSLDDGLGGLVGLHSLPRSEPFYIRTCGMVSLGPDAHAGGLVYFELPQTSVSPFLAK